LFLALQEEFVSVVLPNKAKKYKESLGFKSKTDGIDALALCQMACEQTHSKWNAPGRKMYEMRTLTRQIESITNHATAIKNQLEAVKHSMYPNKQIEKLLEKQIMFFKKQKKELLDSLESLIKNDSELKMRFENVKIIKGLGTLAIATVVAETFGFELFENVAQLVSYSGYDVVENQSGGHKGKTKISKKGNGRIRRCMYFPALSVVRYRVGPFVQLYERVYDRSKIKMKGYTAVQKKLLVIIYTLWKRNEPFQEINKQDIISGDDEKELSFVSASQKQSVKKVAPAETEATQDKHPSKNRSMPSFV
jgi:transposase